MSCYACSKARRGRPTKILVHLCVSLIGLLLLLYLTEVLVASRAGCTVANVLRYYIVLVSLLWNAVEAYNMYLMLIKVFKAHVSSFMVKAVVVAWGELGSLCTMF